MRFVLVDYWHFVFALLGFLVAVCDRASTTSLVGERAPIESFADMTPNKARYGVTHRR
jgi:hypothetical protein